MKQCTKCKKWKTISSFCKDKSKEDGLYSSCKECKNKKNREYKTNNSYKIFTYNYKYRHIHRDEINNNSRLHYNINKNEILAKHKEYRKNNKDKCVKISSSYYQRHKEDWYIKKATRRALEVNATVSYSDKDAIKRIYRTAHILSKMLGSPMEVDHIIPLKNKLVCGLHHQNNLRIISMKWNRRKSNKFNPIIIDIK